MGRAPCCSKVGLHRGPWTTREDTLLTKYIQSHGEGHWRSLPKKAGLLRCGKSCRLRWMNYLRPDIKRGNIMPDEEDLIIRLHSLLGNRWSLIAGRLPGRTDNEIKNYWNTHLSKRLKGQRIDQNSRKRMFKLSLEPKKKKKNNNNNSSSNKKQKKINKVEINGETTETRIHLPKAIRLTSVSITRNNSFDSNTASGSSSHGGEKGILDLPRSDFKDGGTDSGGVLACDEEDDLIINGCDHLSYQSPIPIKNNMLEKLYEEYLQLLKTEEDQAQLDSLAESFFV